MISKCVDCCQKYYTTNTKIIKCDNCVKMDKKFEQVAKIGDSVKTPVINGRVKDIINAKISKGFIKIYNIENIDQSLWIDEKYVRKVIY